MTGLRGTSLVRESRDLIESKKYQGVEGIDPEETVDKSHTHEHEDTLERDHRHERIERNHDLHYSNHLWTSCLQRPAAHSFTLQICPSTSSLPIHRYCS